MRYSYEFKMKCVKQYRKGIWVDTPEGIQKGDFRERVRKWAQIEETCGPDALRHKKHHKVWTAEERFELIARVLAGETYKAVAVSVGIDSGQLYQWVRKYKIKGYNGLVELENSQLLKDAKMKKMNYNNPRKLEESEYEELIRLRAENKYIKAEIEVIKKEIALREKKEAAQLKAKKQQSSRNCKKKDIN